MNKLTKKQKHDIKMIVLITIMIGGFFILSPTVLAEETDPIKVVNNLSDFVVRITKGIGMIILIFGMVQFGISFKSHDPSQRANSALSIVGGLFIYYSKEILNLITK